MRKRGQVTIFIIIAIIIIVIGVLIYLFLPQIKSWISPESKNPSAFLQNCLEDEIENTVETISLQGGSMEPELFYPYQDNKIEYLCYTNEAYRTCVVQQPMLKNHIESEIKVEISEEVDTCLGDLKNSFENDGYKVDIEDGDVVVEILPERIVTTLTHKLTLTRGETRRYDSFKISLNSNLYNLISIARSIIDWEAAYGDVETTTYMDYYHDLKVEKLNQMEGSTVYILTNRDTGEKFQFASRSVAWPPGYGLE